MPEGRNGRVTWWIMGLIAALLTAGSVGLASAIHGHLGIIDASLLERGERLRAVEVQSDGIQVQLRRMEEKQEKMDAKIDRLIERSGR